MKRNASYMVFHPQERGGVLMKKMKKIGIFVGIVSTTLNLGACSLFGKIIYENDYINAVVRNDGKEKVLEVNVRLPSGAPALSKASIDSLTEDGLKKDYEVQLSDGMIYGYHDSTTDHGTETYLKVFESVKELDEELDRSLLQSNGNAYLPGENNFLLTYDKIQGNIDIQAAEVADMERFKVNWNVFMVLDPKKNNRKLFNIYDVSNKIKHESYISQKGVKTELFWDADTGKAVIYALEEGVCYTWELDGKVDEKSVKAYADTIMHKS